MGGDSPTSETLGPISFVLVAGAVGGLVQSLIEVRQPHGVAALGAGVTSVLVAAVFLWVGIRRRRYPVWSIALQLTAASAVADLLGLLAGIAVVVPELHQLQWRDVAINGGSAQLVLSLIRFPVAMVLVAAGRVFLSRGDRIRVTGAPTAGEHFDAVT